MLPRGVMVAQVTLDHFVEVQILTGQPFFCLFFRPSDQSIAIPIPRKINALCVFFQTQQPALPEQAGAEPAQ